MAFFSKSRSLNLSLLKDTYYYRQRRFLENRALFWKKSLVGSLIFLSLVYLFTLKGFDELYYMQWLFVVSLIELLLKKERSYELSFLILNLLVLVYMGLFKNYPLFLSIIHFYFFLNSLLLKGNRMSFMSFFTYVLYYLNILKSLEFMGTHILILILGLPLIGISYFSLLENTPKLKKERKDIRLIASIFIMLLVEIGISK